MDASSIRRSPLWRLALCTGAVAAAVALFPGTTRADDGLSGLVGGTLEGTLEGTAEQLAPPAADPVADVIPTVETAVEEAVPPALDPVVDPVTQAAPAIVDPVLPTAPPHYEAPTDARTGGPQTDETGARVEATTPVTPSADVRRPTAEAPRADVSRPTAEAPARAPAATVVLQLPVAARPYPDARVQASPPENAVPPVSRRPSAESPTAPSPSPVAYAPPVDAAAAEVRVDSGLRPPALPRPSDSGLPGFDTPLPPLAAFALLLALPLGLFALIAPGALGRGVSPVIALLCSADVRFRLVRPG